ncbi:TetR family transcriptional regulator [Marinibaculum pumilum]|uniref:TetR family transcriptional regulator n=1 Tax=Marinibaculum pumilum TaxID=1766165 RepID=A0ABV7KXE8_9PROT
MSTQNRRKAVSAHKRALILDAARAIFEEEGLEGASLRAIAARAGYTPAALYFHFPSKEAIYAAVLHESLAALRAAVDRAVDDAAGPAARLRAAGMAFFDFYAARPRDLDLGFYLFRGGMKSAGLGRDNDAALNAALEAALQPIAASAEELGADRAEAGRIMVDCFAHAAGLLLLAHTGRIRMFAASAPALMEAHLEEKLARLQGPAGA